MAAGNRATLTFFASSLAVALGFAALVPVLLPYGKLGLVSEADREQAWLLTVFCFGMLAILFGAAGWLSGSRWLTVRDVDEAGGVVQARARAEVARRAGGEGVWYRNAGAWTVMTGGFLIAVYFVLWGVLG